MAGMNAGIILAGQPVNVLDALSQGNEAAAQTNAIRQQNALQNLYQQQGAGILAGDANALNALARIDPMAAQGIQQNRLGMEATRQDMAFSAEKMQMLRDETKRAVADHAARMSREQREAEAAQISKGVSGAAFFYSKGDKAGYEAFLAQNGIDPATHPFEQFPALAAQYEGALDALKGFDEMNAPPAPADRFRVVGNTVVDIAAEGGPKPAYTAPTTESGTVVYDPATGNPIVTTGTAKPVKITEQQSKDLVYYERATGSSPTIDANEGALASYAERGADAVPIVGNSLTSQEYQQGNQAGREWLAAILRKDTGAAITSQEFDLYGPMYLPMPGDKPETLKQKREARKRAESAIKRGLGAAEVIANEMLAQRAGSQPQEQGQPLDDEALIQKYLGTSQ